MVGSFYRECGALYRPKRPWLIGELSEAALSDFTTPIIVAGSRNFNDYPLFRYFLERYLLEIPREESVVFISGEASAGADAMIIRWCRENHYPWIPKPADWDQYGKRAGYLRNAEMAAIGKRLLSYWDGMSKGTKHMQDIARKAQLLVQVILVAPDLRKPTHGWKSSRSSSLDYQSHWRDL
jgi:hypothetical protein